MYSISNESLLPPRRPAPQIACGEPHVITNTYSTQFFRVEISPTSLVIGNWYLDFNTIAIENFLSFLRAERIFSLRESITLKYELHNLKFKKKRFFHSLLNFQFSL